MVRNVQLESDLEKWKSVAADFSVDSTISSLRDYIESLQRKELTSNLEINNLKAAFKNSEQKLFSLKGELESAKTNNQELKKTLQKLMVEVQLLRKKTILISRERDSYRQQLDLYEKDLTLSGINSGSSTNDTILQMKSRVQNLEIAVEEYRKHIKVLEVQLKEYQMEEPLENIEAKYKLREEIRNLEESNKILTQLKDELEQKLEDKALKGDFLMRNTKILHFRNNPAVEAEKMHQRNINEIQEECEKLRARIKLLESGEVLNITQKAAENVKNLTNQKVSVLEKELQSTNLKMQRLKEVFKKTSQEFRDVSYMLLGYRIDLASNSKLYKLYNMYSTSPLDFLMFQQTKKGTMEMLGTSFAESLSKLVDEYLHKGNSIPAFLSAVTLELYRLNGHSDDEDGEINRDGGDGNGNGNDKEQDEDEDGDNENDNDGDDDDDDDDDDGGDDDDDDNDDDDDDDDDNDEENDDNDNNNNDDDDDDDKDNDNNVINGKDDDEDNESNDCDDGKERKSYPEPIELD